MIDPGQMRELYESYVGGRERRQPRGRTAFVNQFRAWLGLGSYDPKTGFYADHKDRFGNRVLRESAVEAGRFDMSDLGMALVGPRVMELFGQGSRQLHSELVRYNQLHGLFGDHAAVGSAGLTDGGRSLFEAAGVGVDVSTFADINAWTAATGGLIERKILEQFQSPEFIGDELMTTESTKINEGQKVIGVSRIGDITKERQPGEPHQRAGFVERYVTLGKSRENALAIDVFKESSFFDLSSQVLPTAGSVGEWVAYRKEINQIDAFIGVTTQSGGKYQFSYKGSNYDTYNTSQTIGASTLTTKVTGNELIDWSNLETSWKNFLRRSDPETNTRINPRPNRMLVNPAKWATASLMFEARETERRSANTQGSGTGTAQSTTGDLHILRANGNNVSRFFGDMKPLYSALLEQRCTDANGLNLSQANADTYWWVWQREKFMRWMQLWPVTTVQAPANSYDMVDRGIIMSVFVNERGFPSVWSPWHGQLNTN